MSYGPRGCWRGMCASTLPEPGTPAWLAWRRERCARSLRPTKSSHIKFAITSSAATKRSNAKMAEVLCVYRQVEVLKASKAAAADVAIISYDEKPGIQAI